MFTSSNNIINDWVNEIPLVDFYGYFGSLGIVLKFLLVIFSFIFIFTLWKYIVYTYFDHLLAKSYIRCFFSNKCLNIKDKKLSPLSKDDEKIVEQLKFFKYISLIIQIIILLWALCIYMQSRLIMSIMQEFYFDNLRNLRYLRYDTEKITELRYEIAKFIELKSINEEFANLESLRKKDKDERDELYKFFLEYDRLKKTSIIMLVITLSFLCYKKFF